MFVTRHAAIKMNRSSRILCLAREINRDRIVPYSMPSHRISSPLHRVVLDTNKTFHLPAATGEARLGGNPDLLSLWKEACGMKRFDLFALVLALVFTLGSAAASAQAVSSNPSDAVKDEPTSFEPVRLSLSPWETPKEYEPPASPTLQLSLAPPENAADFGLPLLGDEARKAGYELPKPFGFSLIYTDIQRDVRVTDVRVGLNGNSAKSVSSFVTLQARTHVNVAVGRFDVYLLPFLNVYGLLGYVNNETHIRGTAQLRNGPAVPIDVIAKIEGPVAGLGLTLAGGYKQVFIALDANRSETNLGFADRLSRHRRDASHRMERQNVRKPRPPLDRLHLLGHLRHRQGNQQ